MAFQSAETASIKAGVIVGVNVPLTSGKEIETTKTSRNVLLRLLNSAPRLSAFFLSNAGFSLICPLLTPAMLLFLLKNCARDWGRRFSVGGLSLADAKILAGMLVEAGVDAVYVSAGISGSNPGGLSGQA